MTASTNTIAVLTGDLVASTDLGAARIARAFEALERCAERQRRWHGAPLHFTRQSGDGWQAVLARPELSLRSALAFRAALRALGSAYDGYMAVIEGPGPDPATIGTDLNAQTGGLFVESGHALDAMKTSRAGTRLLHETDGHSGPVAAAFALADHISQGWTPPQAAAFLPMLDPDRPDFTTVAEALGKSRQAVSKALYSAGLGAVTVALTALESPKDPAR